VFKAHRLLYHSTLGLIVMKKKKKGDGPCTQGARLGCRSLCTESKRGTNKPVKARFRP